MRTLATLSDVAQRAGTSVATAGRALGGYGKVAAALATASSQPPVNRPSHYGPWVQLWLDAYAQTVSKKA